MDTPIVPPIDEYERTQQAIIDLVKIKASKGHGSWEVQKMPELLSIRVRYSRKLKSPPFTTYRIDKMVSYDPICYPKHIISAVQYALDEMKKKLDSELLDKLTE